MPSFFAPSAVFVLAGVLFTAVIPAARAADAAASVKGYAPVSVSSANYRTTSRTELLRAVDGSNAAVNPETPGLSPLASPQHFIFMPGEIYSSDLTYEQVTSLLTPALARKGYVNGADAQGIIREPAKVALVLRVHYGMRPWRLPTVRTDDLSWADGLVPRPKGRGLHRLGADQLWDQRAGGNDDAIGAAAANAANPNSFSIGSGASSSGGTGGGTADAQSMAAPGLGTTGAPGFAGYGSTRDFHLIVVDAFDYQELKKDGKAARRLWTTFISAPRDPKQKFSDVAATLIRNATPYFGETTQGLQVYSDTRAEVKIGDLIEVKDQP